MRQIETAGFTLVEILVSLVLFSVAVVIVANSLSSSASLTRTSSLQMSATGLAQQALEQIRGRWKTPSTAAAPSEYDRTCLDQTASFSTTGSVTVQALNYNGAATGNLTFSANCTTPGSTLDVPLKRVTVTVTSNGKTAALSLDIPKP